MARWHFVKHLTLFVAGRGSPELLVECLEVHSVAINELIWWREFVPWLLCAAASRNRVDNVKVLCERLCLYVRLRSRLMHHALVRAAETDSLDVVRHLLLFEKCQPTAIVNIVGWRYWQPRHPKLSAACVATVSDCLRNPIKELAGHHPVWWDQREVVVDTERTGP